MVSPAVARSVDAFGELLLDADIQRSEFAYVRHEVIRSMLEYAHTGDYADLTAFRLAAFFKALAESDKPAADQVLRLWGIRR